MDAKLMIETNFSITDIEEFKSMLARYLATRIVKEIIITLNEENTNKSLSEYHTLISTEIYSVLCKKYKSKTVMRSLKEQDLAIVKNFRDLINAYASDLWASMEKLILIISTNAEFRANCYELFFECLNKNVGGESNDKSREIAKQLEKFR
jgi:hypothetical protein